MTMAELDGAVEVERLLAMGALPKVCDEPNHAVDTLEAYVNTYLQQEIQQEALVKDIGSFFFDAGVVRALHGLLRDPLERAERGPLLETLVFGELRAHIAYAGIGGKLSFFRTPSGGEIDFIWSRGKRSVAFEVKAGSTWRREWSKQLETALQSGGVQRAFGIYLGEEELLDGPVRVLPLFRFAERLAAGELL